MPNAPILRDLWNEGCQGEGPLRHSPGEARPTPLEGPTPREPGRAAWAGWHTLDQIPILESDESGNLFQGSPLPCHHSQSSLLAPPGDLPICRLPGRGEWTPDSPRGEEPLRSVTCYSWQRPRFRFDCCAFAAGEDAEA